MVGSIIVLDGWGGGVRVSAAFCTFVGLIVCSPAVCPGRNEAEVTGSWPCPRLQAGGTRDRMSSPGPELDLARRSWL